MDKTSYTGYTATKLQTRRVIHLYLVEDEPKSRGDSEQDKYGSGDASTKLNQKENKCLKRGGGGGEEGS
jgi:hypothetical protein